MKTTPFCLLSKMIRKKNYCLWTIVVFGIVSCVYYTMRKPSHVLEPLQQYKPNRKFTILIMYPQFGTHKPVDQLPKECGNCEVSVDRNKVNNGNTKALIFHFNDPTFDIAPKHRRLDQHYVWFTGEGPVAIYHLRKMNLREYDGFFNLTMSYRRDSDIWAPFGTTLSLWKQNKNLPLSDNAVEKLIKKKSRTALWVVSNCNVMPHARERKSFVMELIDNGLQVDLGGGCFDNIKDDFENHKYKFYLAFENQWNCKDYITEKFWDNALKHGTVPVVLGPPKKDYELVAPSSNSFIYAADFDSPKDLADFLNYLDKNDTAYKEYLSWMKIMPHIQEQEKKTDFCQLCSFLHKVDQSIPNVEPRVVHSLYDWFFARNYQQCLNVPNLGTEI